MAFDDAKRADELLALLEKYAPRLSPVFWEAWIDGALQVKLSELIALIRAGLIDDAIELLTQGVQASVKLQVEQQLRPVFFSAASWAWERDRPVRGPTKALRVAFDQLNPITLAAVKRNELRLVQEVTQSTREGVRSYLVDAVNRGVNPRTIARELRSGVGLGLTASQEATVQRYRAFLQTVHEKQSLKALGIGLKRQLGYDRKGRPIDGIEQWRLRDMRFDRLLAQANKTKKPLTKAQIEEQVNRYRERMIKLRSETIARTEMIKSGAIGSKEAWRQMVETGIYPDGVRRFWFTAKGERTCPVCSAIQAMNKEGRGLDEPFMGPDGEMIDDPPAHPSCRCTVFVRPVILRAKRFVSA